MSEYYEKCVSGMRISDLSYEEKCRYVSMEVSVSVNVFGVYNYGMGWGYDEEWCYYSGDVDD